jgi:predicted GNAT family N-acyltransferase
MEIQIIKKIDRSLKLKLDNFADKNWGETTDSEEYLNNNFFDQNKIAITLNKNNKLVGLLYLHERKTKFKNISVQIGCIGGVVVDKNMRRHGLATMLLKSSKDIMLKDGIDVAVLCTDIDKLGNLYIKSGFVPLGRPYYYTDKNGVERTDNGGMIAPVTSNVIFKSILNSKSKFYVGISNF